MITRNKDGELVFNPLWLQVTIQSMFDACESEDEVQMVKKELQELSETFSDTRLDELDSPLMN